MRLSVPIRQAFFVQMVGKEDLPNAIALNSSILTGRVWWGRRSLVLRSHGSGRLVFLSEWIEFAAVIVALLMMRIERSAPKPSDGSPLKSLVQGFQFAMTDLPIRSALLLLSVLSLFGLQYSFSYRFMRRHLKGGAGHLDC